jgi:hypothetical protein
MPWLGLKTLVKEALKIDLEECVAWNDGLEAMLLTLPERNSG